MVYCDVLHKNQLHFYQKKSRGIFVRKMLFSTETECLKMIGNAPDGPTSVRVGHKSEEHNFPPEAKS